MDDFIHHLPIVHRGGEAVAVFDWLREVETIHYDVHMAAVGGANHLVGDIKSVGVGSVQELVAIV